jgi:hypothetical protein
MGASKKTLYPANEWHLFVEDTFQLTHNTNHMTGEQLSIARADWADHCRFGGVLMYRFPPKQHTVLLLGP